MNHTRDGYRYRKTIIVIALAALTAFVSGVVTPAYADGEEPSRISTPLRLEGGARGDVTAGLASVASYWEPNPWGCDAISDHPHESTKDPGHGWINAKARTECSSSPPVVLWHMIQRLYRSSWSGWRLVNIKFSSCPVGTGDPDCEDREMQGVISWDCPAGTWYNYRLQTIHQIIDGDRIYTGNSLAQTGPVRQTGTVECSR